MRKLFLTALFAISAFLCSAMASVGEPIKEVIVERGSNCYTAVLDASGKMTDNAPDLLTRAIVKAVTFVSSFDYTSLIGFATMAGIAIVSSFDAEVISNLVGANIRQVRDVMSGKYYSRVQC